MGKQDLTGKRQAREGSEGRGLDDKASGREARAAGLDFVPRAAEAITAEGYGCYCRWCYCFGERAEAQGARWLDHLGSW